MLVTFLTPHLLSLFSLIYLGNRKKEAQILQQEKIMCSYIRQRDWDRDLALEWLDKD